MTKTYGKRISLDFVVEADNQLEATVVIGKMLLALREQLPTGVSVGNIGRTQRR